MDVLAHLAHGFGAALTPTNLAMAFVGSLLGTVVGVLPGLGRPAEIERRDPPTMNPLPLQLNRVYFENLSFSSSGSRQSLTQRRSATTQGCWLMRAWKAATRRVRSSRLAWQWW